MSKVIVYTRPDGGVSVVNPGYNDRARPEGDTDEKLLERCMARLPANAVNPHIVERDTLPTDRTFRDAWTFDGKDFGVDVEKARDIQAIRLKAEQDERAKKAADDAALAAIRATLATATLDSMRR